MAKTNKLIMFRSGGKYSPFAVDYNFYIFESVIQNVDFKNVRKLVLSKEKRILDTTPLPETDGNTGLGKKSLTSRFNNFNVLSWNNKDIWAIKKSISENLEEFCNKLLIEKPEKLNIQCWANVMRQGEKIKPHVHDTSPYAFLSGHVCISSNKTKTYYINPFKSYEGKGGQEVYSSSNNAGTITLFSSNVPHYTDADTDKKERVTIAFDISPEDHGRFNNDNYIEL
jgi:hypothetical protein